MAIEKAFAIEAEPGVIWDALWAEVSQGDKEAFRVERSSRPELLELALSFGGVPVLLTYRIEQKPEFAEVSATLEPLSFKYRLYQALSFGHLRRNYEMLLVEGLANLKEAVEGEAAE